MKQYAAFGETTHDTLGVTRQSYIGKEKDVENGLGDHGVRKYDYETGRFNSIDPLWEKYYGWSPYQYCMNNPIWAKDYNGKAAIAAPLGYPVVVGGGLAVGKILVFVGTAMGSAVLVAEGENIIKEAAKLETAMTATKENPVTLNPNAQDATATSTSSAEIEAKYNEFIENSKPMEQAEHTQNKSKVRWDKHSNTRSGGEYGTERNNKRGDKNKKYQKPKNSNKKPNKGVFYIEQEQNSNDNNSREDNNDQD